ncbi:MAG: chemotaxis protein CheC [Candidatus Parabeggiatoa sp.]|nr:chemotaxis protein CheC [Candidatus Parabeggiatoa sp.]
MKDYNEDQYDLLRELTNIAIGQAAAELDGMLNTTVDISIPKVSLVSFTDMRGKFLEIYASFSEVSVVKQTFEGLLNGEALLIFGEEAMSTVAVLLGEDVALSLEREQALLHETSHILANACLNGLAESLESEINITQSSLFCLQKPFMDFLNDLFPRGKRVSAWKYSLLINVILKARTSNFDCFIVIFLSEPSIDKLRCQLDKLIEEEY